MPLVEKIYDKRTALRRKTAIFVPVGDLNQLEMFMGQVKRLGLNKDFDFILLYRFGLKVSEIGLSAICFRELMPIGTSGAFFEGHKLAYELGYETLIVADADALLDSRKTLDNMISISEKTGKAIAPLSIQKENKANKEYSVINQWGVIPTKILAEIGFCTPYMWRGGEDYEFKQRLISKGMFKIYRNGNVEHPLAGYTIYHKMVQPKKFYPYVNGLLKAMLFEAEYNWKAYAKYFAWSMFYSFFTDAFGDRQLLRIAKESSAFNIPDWVADETPAVSISQEKEQAQFTTGMLSRILYIPLSLERLIIKGEFPIYTDRIKLTIPRKKLLVRSIVAAALKPIRAIQTMKRIIDWKNERKKVIFPIMPKDAERAEKIYMTLIKQKYL
jgi:hypothetical protein